MLYLIDPAGNAQSERLLPHCSQTFWEAEGAAGIEDCITLSAAALGLCLEEPTIPDSL